jgi:hypothetical protein
MKQDKMGGCCSMHFRYEKCMLNSYGRSENKTSLWRHLHRCKTVLKVDFTSVSATLPAFAAVLKWHIDAAVAALSYFSLSWLIFCSKRRPWNCIRLPSVKDQSKYQ